MPVSSQKRKLKTDHQWCCGGLLGPRSAPPIQLRDDSLQNNRTGPSAEVGQMLMKLISYKVSFSQPEATLLEIG